MRLLINNKHSAPMKKIVLLRHGHSVWNEENRFTGWADVDLSARGREEALLAGLSLKEAGFELDLAYTSLLKRAIKTLWIGLEAMDRMWMPVQGHWRLNERHYGDLQGLNKAETATQFGEAQVLQWRRSYDIPPPLIALDDPRCEINDPRYAHLTREQFPRGESLKDTVARVLPYWNEVITPSIQEGRNIIIVAHGNSLRALVKHLDNMDDESIVGLNIPTGIPLVYELDDNLKAVKHYYLGAPEKIAQSVAAVANQGRAKP